MSLCVYLSVPMISTSLEQGFSEEERKAFTQIVYYNVIRAIQTLIKQVCDQTDRVSLLTLIWLCNNRQNNADMIGPMTISRMQTSFPR